MSNELMLKAQTLIYPNQDNLQDYTEGYGSLIQVEGVLRAEVVSLKLILKRNNMRDNESGKPKFSWWIFIILLIVFWPFSILYALISR